MKSTESASLSDLENSSAESKAIFAPVPAALPIILIFKYYSLTPAGLEYLVRMLAEWQEILDSVSALGIQI